MANAGPFNICSLIAVFCVSPLIAQNQVLRSAALAKDPAHRDAPCTAFSAGTVQSQDCGEDGAQISLTEQELLRRYPPITSTYRDPDPDTDKTGASGGTVSAVQLENPLSKRAKKLLNSAQANLKAGKTSEAMVEIKSALEDPSAAPYTHGILGAYYLKVGQLTQAILELREAVRLIPGYQVFRSNLAFALLSAGQYADAESEARQALRLAWNSPQAHYVLAMALLGQHHGANEAVDHLHIAAATLTCAREALVKYETSNSTP